MKNSKLNESPSRREFVACSSAAVAPFFVRSSALGNLSRRSAGNRITMATIGTGGRGTGDMRAFMKFPEVQMVAVCDPVTAHRERACELVNQHYGNQDCEMYNDFRDVLARDDIDAVLIGTPDHWHALITIAACEAGKDIFCEKPESLTVREGRAMADAINRYGTVFSGGSQRVLGDFGDWPRLVRGGALGEIQEVFIGLPSGPSGDCYLPAEPVPEGVDWDMWLGPAPWRPFHPTLIRGKFRLYRDYSGGGMTDWGAHKFGAALFATGLHKTGPVEVLPPNSDDVPHLTFRFENGVRMYHGGANNIKYVGTEGRLCKGKDEEQTPSYFRPLVGRVEMEGYHGRGGIFGDFLHCVRTRETPFRDIETAHRTTTVCHLGNIAYWLNRPLKWDPVKEEIIGDPEASRWLDRPKRSPWVL